MPSASPSATTTMRISSTSDPEDDDDDPFLVVFATSRYSRLAGLLVTAVRRFGVGGRLRLGGFGLGDGLLVQSVGLGEGLRVHRITEDLGVGRSGGLRRRVVQDAALDDLLRTGVAALADAGALADAAAQVVELGAADVTAGGDFNPLDLRRVQRERALHADAEGLLAHREGLAHALALAFDDYALEDLGAPAGGLDDLEGDPGPGAGSELRDAAELRPLQTVDDGAHWREKPAKRKGPRGAAAYGSEAPPPSAPRARACSRRHCRMRS